MDYEEALKLSPDEVLAKANSAVKNCEIIEDFGRFLKFLTEEKKYISRVEEGVSFWYSYHKNHPKDAKLALDTAKSFLLNLNGIEEMSDCVKNILSTINGNLKHAWEIYQKYGRNLG